MVSHVIIPTTLVPRAIRCLVDWLVSCCFFVVVFCFVFYLSCMFPTLSLFFVFFSCLFFSFFLSFSFLFSVVHQAFFIVSAWSFKFCQLHKVTPGRVTRSKFFYTSLEHRSLLKSQVKSCFTILSTTQWTANAYMSTQLTTSIIIWVFTWFVFS